MHASALTDAGRACTQHSAPMLMLSTPPKQHIQQQATRLGPHACYPSPPCGCTCSPVATIQTLRAQRHSTTSPRTHTRARCVAALRSPAPSIGAFSKAVYGVRRGGMPRAKSSLAQQAYPSRRGCGPSPVAIARYRCTRKKTFCRPLSWDHTTLTLPWQLPVPYKPDCARKLPNYTTFITPTCSSAAGPMPLHISETPALHPMPTIVKQ
ncbi:hypothetical protein COCVIDRAFT_38516 [Bipolaris victoriae FI3]|uniref:Uncharacterized protein n=1 Tax=Bipolaris victoriae (strain FI3) TaxID=930091 RepID=W7EK74_BIPV3|nr:hypothetical protein COCVIDRAFT_38516 [Bipolaris victoriae FI3]